MDHRRHPYPTDSLLTYSPEEIELHRVRERHMVARQRRAVAAQLGRPERQKRLRLRLGAALIRAGAWLAGDGSQPAGVGGDTPAPEAGSVR